MVDFSMRPVTDRHGRVQLLVTEGRDITTLKRREQHLQVLHRLLRHNLRNELNVVNGFAETLRSELEDDVYREYAAEIEETSAGLIEMTETAKQLADIALEGSEQQTPIGIGAVLDRVVADLADRFPDSTITVRDSTDATVAADSRVDVVLEEIVHNAIAHTDDQNVEIAVDVGDDAVDVRVSDTGPGIPESERAGIFNEEPITQVRHGNGLGLWLASLIVDDYGGALDYEPRADGGGSCVIVRLPRAQ